MTLTDYVLKWVALKLRKKSFFSFLNQILSYSVSCTLVSHIGKPVVSEPGCSQSNTAHDFRFHPHLYIFHGTLLQQHEGIGYFHRIQKMYVKVILLSNISKFYKRDVMNGMEELQLDIKHAEMNN